MPAPRHLAVGQHLEFGEFPDGSPRFVSAAFKNLDHALDAAHDLESCGYAHNRISVFMGTAAREQYLDTHPRYVELERTAIAVDTVELEKRTRLPEGAGVGGAIGGAVGAAGAAVIAMGTTLVVPPLGIALAGPIAAVLAGLGAGAAAGGVVGALVGAGLSEYSAHDFKRLIDEGRIIVGVTADTIPERAHIRDVLAKHGGDIGTAGRHAS